jgi:NAD-dependent deacetylase
VHGDLLLWKCIKCNKQYQISQRDLIDLAGKILASEETFFDNLETCEKCSGYLRPDVVLFGEDLHHLNEVLRLLDSADTVIVIGTSGTVYPFAMFPGRCYDNGGRVVVVDPNYNGFEKCTNVFIQERASIAMPALVQELQKYVN